ncbi:hypothetical protein CTAYLR_006027 [Chrysophaeum taylorii]|uniref:Nuclear protein Es2 n=1 Tax=Chrysophaeum taylorii TaxID=2483200 RepID=A0AAD7UKJ0_9STRA|nr:hypothetical protein CTAYLR_006027 [Chrysophaeum taylorii]
MSKEVVEVGSVEEEKEEGKKGSRGVLGVRMMALPPPRASKRRKIVMEEEEYLDALERIITRDYFPEVARGSSLPLSVDEFAARYTSEDNDSFDKILEKDAREHARKFWWSYDADRLIQAGVDVPDPSAPGLHLLSDGSHISRERRLIADKACAASPTRDDRVSGLNFSRYRARNNLLFPAEVDPRAGPPRIEAAKDNPRCGARVSEAAVEKANTRFEEGDDGAISSRLDKDPVYARRELVPMTPVIEPGGANDPAGASPFVTWGRLAAPPQPLVDDRQELGRRLDAKAKKRLPTPSPLRLAIDGRRSRGAAMSPAVRALAKGLHGGRFDATAALRASYLPPPSSSSSLLQSRRPSPSMTPRRGS